MNDDNSRLRHRNPITERDHAPVDVRNGLIGYECSRCGEGVSFLPRAEPAADQQSISDRA